MGFNAVWPMGIFPIGERHQWGTAGGSPFSIRDHSTINPALGTEDDFRNFVRNAHIAGVKVIVDFVVNHASMDSRLLDENPDYFIHMKPAPMQIDPPPGYYEYQRQGKWLWVHHGGYEVFGSISTWNDTAQIDYSRRETRTRMTQILKSWVERFDIDGYRVDMAHIVLNGPFGRNWKKKMPPEEFLASMIREVKSLKPSAAFIAEAYSNQDELSACGFDAIYSKYETQRPEGQTGWYDSSANGNPAEQANGINRAAYMAWQKGGAGSVSFIGNHDEKAPERIYGARLPACLTMTLLLPGSVMVYSGAEIGFDAAKPWEEKPLPFSVPVQIDWNAGDARVRAVYKESFAVANRIRAELGDYDIEPLWPPNGQSWAGYIMRSKTNPGAMKAVIGNMTWQETGAVISGPFNFSGRLRPGEYRIIDFSK